MENTMQNRLSLKNSFKNSLHFLKGVRRARLAAALASSLIALWCMWWLYDQEFHYPNTDAGRQAALQDYIPAPASSDSLVHQAVKAGTPLRTVAYAGHGRYLYIYYAAENEDHIHGILRLVRGINGKYRPLDASITPFPYTAGVQGQEIRAGNTSPDHRKGWLYALAGDNCAGIHSAAVTYRGELKSSGQTYTWEKTYPITEPCFLWLTEWDALEADLGIPEGTLLSIFADDIRLLDENGQDITEQFRDESVDAAYSGGKSTAELFLVYLFMGIAAALGIVFVRYFLRRD